MMKSKLSISGSNLRRLSTRRELLCSLAGLGVAHAGWGTHQKLETSLTDPFIYKPNEWIIEWNTHIFSSNVARYPFHPQAVYKPAVSTLPVDPLAVYRQRMAAEKIDRAIIVQPEPYGDDHTLLLETLRQEPNRMKGTSLFYPNDPAAPRKLVTLVQQEPRIISTRFHAHRDKDMYLTTFADSGVRALWKQAVDLGLIIELHIGPNYARQAGKAIAAFPGCKVLIDHLAEPHMGTGVEFADVLELARLSNVYMKLSGLGHFATDSPYFESALPFTHRVIQEFGVDRMVWGDGSPSIVDKHMAAYSERDRAKVKGENLRKLLNWT